MSKPVIVCIDDEKSVLNTLEEQLNSKLDGEFDIELAISGDEALELMEELKGRSKMYYDRQADSFLCDLVVPSLNCSANLLDMSIYLNM